MDGLALLLYAAFFTAAFGWRTWLQWRRTGDTGLRMHAEPGSLQWWAKLGFVAALVAGVAAPIAGLAGMSVLCVLDTGAVRGAGAVIAVGGILATVAAQWQMGESWRIGVDPTERTGLVTEGIFAHVRNPIFTAMLIAAVGFALMVGNWVAVAGLAALVTALEVQVRAVEEPYLARTHGAAYDAYRTTAGRFLPGIGRRQTR
ncbi:MAG: methyltransferase family protein [Acidimicrobiia bacterium]|jgi:protein-S-isoprenylcysteine O-methyltransferase Ste14